jgi:hypothetical protein
MSAPPVDAETAPEAFSKPWHYWCGIKPGSRFADQHRGNADN